MTLDFLQVEAKYKDRDQVEVVLRVLNRMVLSELLRSERLGQVPCYFYEVSMLVFIKSNSNRKLKPNTPLTFSAHLNYSK